MSKIAAHSPGLRGDLPAIATPQAFADRKALALICVERTRMPMVVTDVRQADNPIVLANQAFIELTGYRGEEILGRNCRFLQGEATNSEHVEAVRAAIRERREATVELLNYRRDGAAFWNELHLCPIFGEEGELIYFFASQLDVTERRKAQALQAAEHRLLREVDHRSMNVLALVDGIVRLSKADEPRGYALSIQRRVRALALAHGMLAAKGWRSISLEDIVRSQVEPGDRIALAGPEVPVSPTLAQPLALVIEELKANAIMHGALSTDAGRLTVDWWLDEPARKFGIRWIERGAPAREEGLAGFGSTMIKAIIERQLRGKLRRERRSDGLAVEIELHASGPLGELRF